MNRLRPVFLFLFSAAVLHAQTSEPSAGRWTSFGDGPSNSGFYPVTIGDATAVPGWAKSFGGQPINEVAVSDGRVVVTSNPYTDRGYPPPPGLNFVVALDAVTGNELWRNSLAGGAAPTVDEHHVFLQSFKLFALKLEDGSVDWARDVNNLSSFSTPVAVGDRLFVDNEDGIFSFRVSDNSQRFFAESPQPYYGCGHSYYGGLLYVTDPTTFRAVDPETGARLWTIPRPQNGIGLLDGGPAIMNDKAAVIAFQARTLSTVDLKTRSIRWTVSGNFLNRPANDGLTVYALAEKGVNAYAADTGELRGRYNIPVSSGEYFPRHFQPLVTNDLVLIGTSRATYIFDKATFNLRTQLGVGGYLSFAAGVLYVADEWGNLTTFRFPNAGPEAAPSPWPSPTPAVAPLVPADVEMISVNNQGTAAANFVSSIVGISAANARFVLFASSASDLTTVADDNKQPDLFLRDRQTGTTQMVTVNYNGTGAAGPANTSGPSDAQLTPDGRFVVFSSVRNNYVPDIRSSGSVFVRDMQAGKTTVVSVDLDGVPRPGSGPRISADGRYVAFTSSAKNLVPNQANGPASDVYVRDLLANTTRLVSIDEGDRGVGSAEVSSLTRNGRFVLYWAASAAGQQTAQLFLRDLQTGTKSKISVSIYGTDATNGSFEQSNAHVSEDGRFVVFQSPSTDLVAGDPDFHTDIFIRDVLAGTTQRIESDTYADNTLCDVSADGQVIAFVRRSGVTNVIADNLFIYDQRTRRIEEATPGEAQPLSACAKMDPTGRFIIFESWSSSEMGINEDTNGAPDMFLIDRQLRTTRLISHNVNRTGSANAQSQIRFANGPVISDDGQTVVFESAATNLSSLPSPQVPNTYFFNVYASTIQVSGQLLNISTRGEVLTGDKTLIGGFVVTGAAPKKIIIRATGPSLAAAGLQGVLGDPVLELYNQAGTLIASNDNWRQDEAQVSLTGVAPANDLESAIVRTLDPGAYTAVVRGKNGSTGIAVVELYDLAQDSDSKLANISTRGVVGGGDEVMIAGFIAGSAGGGGSRVLIRAMGPSLASFGVAEALQDPALELRDANGALVTQNDNWKDTQRAEIEASGIPPANDAESAIVYTLAPGSYTGIVTGNGGTGVALVEVYRLQ